MKNKLIIPAFLAALAIPAIVRSQDSIVEKKDARIQMSYFVNTDDEASMKVTVSHRVDRAIVYGEHVRVDLYLNEQSDSTLISKGLTNADGNVEFPLMETLKKIPEAQHSFDLLAVIANDAVYNDAEKTRSIKEASLKMELVEEDSSHQVKATLMQYDSTGELAPVPDVEIKFFVQRLFSLLPIGGSYTYTDESGEVYIDFPDDLPGDVDGMVDIVVRLADHEDFGTLEKREKAAWGVPLVIDQSALDHKLWSSRMNAPIALVLISWAIILGIWGTIGYLVSILIKIKKLGKSS